MRIPSRKTTAGGRASESGSPVPLDRRNESFRAGGSSERVCPGVAHLQNLMIRFIVELDRNIDGEALVERL